MFSLAEQRSPITLLHPKGHGFHYDTIFFSNVDEKNTGVLLVALHPQKPVGANKRDKEDKAGI